MTLAELETELASATAAKLEADTRVAELAKAVAEAKAYAEPLHPLDVWLLEQLGAKPGSQQDRFGWAVKVDGKRGLLVREVGVKPGGWRFEGWRVVADWAYDGEWAPTIEGAVASFRAENARKNDNEK